MKLLTEFHMDISWWNLISKAAFLITFTRERESTRFFPWGGRRAELKLNVKIFICLGEEFDIHMVV